MEDCWQIDDWEIAGLEMRNLAIYESANLPIQRFPLRGREIVNIAGPSPRFAALTLPPCSSTRWRTMDKPRPVGPGSRVRDLSTR